MSRQITAISVPEAPAATEAPATSGQVRPEVETAPTVAAHPCDVCPTRSTAENQTFDYCEGCTRTERLCPGCQQHKPQVGWWWGLAWGRLDWMCADCRLPPLDADAAARDPALAASHPALRELAAGRGRFAADLELDDLERRFEAAQAISRAAAMLAGEPAALALSRMAAGLRVVDFDGRVDVDVSDVDVPGRQRVTAALHNAAYGKHTPQAATEPLARLMRDWERWVDAEFPARRRPPTAQEQQARERAAVRAARERPAG